MRVLLSTPGTRGDVQPLVALASELKALGQEVRLCVRPEFREWIVSLGIPVTAIGHAQGQAAASSLPATLVPGSPERRLQLMAAAVRAQYETIAEAAQGCDMIVTAAALQVGARSLAEKMGIPYVFAAYCPTALPSPHHPPPPMPPALRQMPASPAADNRERWARDAESFNDLFGKALNAHRASVGLPPIDDAHDYVLTARPWLAADPVLAPWPEPVNPGVIQTGAWILADDRPLSAELEMFLETGEPPVYFGFGSMRVPEDFSRVMIEAARSLGRRAIVSRGWANLSLPDGGLDCLAIGEVNQQALFRRVAAVVHHGGAGTTTGAAFAGTPQVVIPQIYDQHYWAQRIHDLGIGRQHAPGTPTTNSLRDALEQALQPSVAARAQSLAAMMCHDGARTAAQRLCGTSDTA